MLTRFGVAIAWLVVAGVGVACQAGAPPASSILSPSTEPSRTFTPTAQPSRTFTPTAIAVPDNDDPPGISIASLPFTHETNTAEAQIHAMEPGPQCASGNQSVWYAFNATADETLVADTFGSDYDTIVDVFEGRLTSNVMEPGFERLVRVACNDNASGTPQSEVVFAARAGQAYVIRVSTAFEAQGGSLTFHLSEG